jgi:hypothetical protein
MAPGISFGDHAVVDEKSAAGSSELTRLSGALDKGFEFDDVTPAIGREYPTLNIVNDLLNANNSDELLRDLAITSELSSVQPYALFDHIAVSK